MSSVSYIILLSTFRFPQSIMWNLYGSSKLVVERELQREHQQHQLKLLDMRPRIDTRPPKPMSHLTSKARKRRMQDDRNEVIRRENQLLLQKMIEIDTKPSSVTLPVRQTPLAGSLNRFVRISELTKISRENQAILKRLQRTQSAYSVKRWDRANQYNEDLKHYLSQNAGRVPRQLSYVLSPSTPCTRPHTAQHRLEREEDSVRPFTAEGRPRSGNVRSSL